MESFYEAVNPIGEAILNWADPEEKFRGYTEVIQ
jgi:hypothetical protein